METCASSLLHRSCTHACGDHAAPAACGVLGCIYMLLHQQAAGLLGPTPPNIPVPPLSWCTVFGLRACVASPIILPAGRSGDPRVVLDGTALFVPVSDSTTKGFIVLMITFTLTSFGIKLRRTVRPILALQARA